MSEKSSFLNHAIVLKKYIIRIFILISIGFIISFSFKEIIFDDIILIVKNPNFITYRVMCKLSVILNIEDTLCIKNIPLSIQNRTLSGQFSTHILVSLFSGIVLMFPLILYQIWNFLKPGLKTTETMKIKKALFWVTILFFIGVLFGYFVITPLSINFLANYSISDEVSNQIDLNSFINVVIMMVIASGSIFLLPVFIYFLTKIGIIDYIFLKKYRRHAIVIIFIFSAIITPPDITSQILISIPMLFLYEVGVFIAKRNEKNKL